MGEEEEAKEEIGADEPTSFTGLPEVDEELVFSSTETRLPLPSDFEVGPAAKALAVMLLLAGASGLITGWDYTQPEKGVVRPHEWVWSMGKVAPNGTAILDGVITMEDGNPAVGYEVLIVMDSSTSAANESWWTSTMTDEGGEYHFEGLSPGMVSFEVFSPDNATKGVQHRLLLTPPAAFEPLGFTNIDIVMPSEGAHLEAYTTSGNTSYWIDYSDEEMDFPLLDPSAIGVYVMLGFLFCGLAILSMVFAVLGYRSGSRGQLRVSGILVTFSVGFYWTACCLGPLAVALTFALPKRLQ